MLEPLYVLFWLSPSSYIFLHRSTDVVYQLFINPYFSPCSDNGCVVLIVLPCVSGYFFNVPIEYKFLNI